MFRRVIIVPLATCLGACAASPMLPGSETILVSKDPAPAGCEFLGEVQGDQGNFWTAEFTSDADLINGAHQLEANYVKIETESFSDNTADDSLGGTYSAVVIGNAYRCSKELLASQ